MQELNTYFDNNSKLNIEPNYPGDLMSKLDNNDYLAQYDRSGMLDYLAHFASQCRDAWRIGLDTNLPPLPMGGISKVLVIGMGGSAIGGDLVRDYAMSRSRIVFQVVKGCMLPKWVDSETLVIGVSHSGNTEETISGYLQARAKGAFCLGLTGGGKLASLAAANQGLVLVPNELPPRNSLAYLTLPLLLILARYGLLSISKRDLLPVIDGVNSLVSQVNKNVKGKANIAKDLACCLYGKVPVIWGVSGSTGGVAYRFKGQFNENSKVPAYCNVLPELNHNEICGVGSLPELEKRLGILVLRTQGDCLFMQKRIEKTKSLWESKVAFILDVWADGKTALAKLFYLILLGDFTSAYLACLYQTDPTDICLIEQLKSGV